ncbi:hypothetical protein JW905_15740 [bacterium]|nr:hypothetical protein [candidate division CSSED10-310 bacterium]
MGTVDAFAGGGAVFRSAFSLWLAGGWALDLFLGRRTRDHGDTDVLVVRRHQSGLWRHLRDWNLFKAVRGELLPWLERLVPAGQGDNPRNAAPP